MLHSNEHYVWIRIEKDALKEVFADPAGAIVACISRLRVVIELQTSVKEWERRLVASTKDDVINVTKDRSVRQDELLAADQVIACRLNGTNLLQTGMETNYLRPAFALTELGLFAAAHVNVCSTILTRHLSDVLC